MVEVYRWETVAAGEGGGAQRKGERCREGRSNYANKTGGVRRRRRRQHSGGGRRDLRVVGGGPGYVKGDVSGRGYPGGGGGPGTRTVACGGDGKVAAVDAKATGGGRRHGREGWKQKQERWLGRRRW